VRNLLRGYRLAVPTGQAVAAELATVRPTSTQLTEGGGGVADALLDNPKLLRDTQV